MQNFEYVVVSGASRKNEKWEHTEGESVSIEGKEEAAKIASDPMYRLEHHAEDEKKAEDSTPRIDKLLVCDLHYTSMGINTVVSHRLLKKR